MTPVAGLPAGPSASPLRQTLRWVREPVDVLDDCSANYGETFTLRFFGMPPMVMLSDPRAIKQVFTGDPEVLRSGAANAFLEALVGRNSLLLLDGERHLRERKLLLPPLHGDRLRVYESVIASVAQRSIDRWPRGQPFAVAPYMQAITLEVIRRAVIGVDAPERAQRLERGLKRLLDVSSQPYRVLALLLMKPGGPVMRAWRRWGPLMRRVNHLLLEEIRMRRVDPALAEREDILSLLLRAEDEDGRPLDDEHVRDELITLLAAGHDTTATALAWALERLARKPEMLARIADDGDAYGDAVARETLRVRPVLAFALRELAAPVEVGGRAYPTGVRLAPCAYLLHRRPDIYPDPEEFRPERFLDDAPGTYEWIPFGGGTRRCIGASFALLEMRGVLTAVARGGALRPAQPGAEAVRRRGVTFAPAAGSRVIFEPHSPRNEPVRRSSSSASRVAGIRA